MLEGKIREAPFFKGSIWKNNSLGRSWLNLQYCRNTSSSLVKENQTDLVYIDCELKTGYPKRSQKYWGLLPDFVLSCRNISLRCQFFWVSVSFILLFPFWQTFFGPHSFFSNFVEFLFFVANLNQFTQLCLQNGFFIIVGITSYKFENPHYHSSIYVAMAKIILPISDPHLDTLLMFESTILWFDWTLFH